MQVRFFQSPVWGELKSQFGWQSDVVEAAGHRLPLYVRSVARFYQFAYIPYGFDSISEARGLFDELISTLKARYPRLLFIRFDLSDYREFDVKEGIDPSAEIDVPKCLKKSADVQPPDTVIISLKDQNGQVSEEALLAAMHKKTRYNIRLAEKKGVRIIESDANRLRQWYELYEITARRDRIAIHSFEYYRALFDISVKYTKQSDSENSNYQPFTVKLYLAEHEGDLLAGIVVVQYHGQAFYLYGASSNEKRNLMPAYALQWQAIRDASSAGCESYDFFGIPPANDPSHPMHGLYRFKTGFGGRLIHRAGAWDLPVKSFVYRFFRFAESIRLFYFKKLKKKLSSGR